MLWGRYNIGIFDLLLLTAIAGYWHKRGGDFLVPLAPGTIGLLLAVGTSRFITGGLPLIPFLTVGWFVSLVIYRFRNQTAMNVAGGKPGEEV